jgi:RNA polymerase sigma-70 factor (ECF subfamily)
MQVIRRNALYAIWKATGKLSPKQLFAFQLRYAQDMTVQEIAAAMDVTEGTVKVHLYRAIESIRITLHSRTIVGGAVYNRIGERRVP